MVFFANADLYLHQVGATINRYNNREGEVKL